MSPASGLSIAGLTTRYGHGRSALTAVDGIDLTLAPGSILGLVGESGSGKSSLARALVGLAPVSAGTITLDGACLTGAGRPAARRRRRVQMVFQDPYSSLDPRMSIGESIAEAVRAAGSRSRARRGGEVERLLDLVGLDQSLAGGLPRALSGGQRQRVAIARALGARPRVLIADEITSALDVSVQGAVLNLVRDLQRELGLSVLFISHNLAVVHHIADTIAVMYCGKIVEIAPAGALVARPQHPYTRALVAAARPGCATESAAESDGELLVADPPDPRDPPAGCRFHPRCPDGPLGRSTDREICRHADPGSEAAGRPHRAACFFAADPATTDPATISPAGTRTP
ncbi:MAG: ABC transporter ATP-binding protein [Mycobacteriales bacterium]